MSVARGRIAIDVRIAMVLPQRVGEDFENMTIHSLKRIQMLFIICMTSSTRVWPVEGCRKLWSPIHT